MRGGKKLALVLFVGCFVVVVFFFQKQVNLSSPPWLGQGGVICVALDCFLNDIG